MRVLGPFFDVIDADFSALREIARDLLQQEKDLSEIVQLVGRDSLSEDQKVVLELAKIIREDYLQQNAFSEHDFNCPLTKSVGMLRVIVQLYRRALKAVTGSDATGAAAATAAGAKTITWNVIKATQSKLINRVTVSVERDMHRLCRALALASAVALVICLFTCASLLLPPPRPTYARRT